MDDVPLTYSVNVTIKNLAKWLPESGFRNQRASGANFGAKRHLGHEMGQGKCTLLGFEVEK